MARHKIKVVFVATALHTGGAEIMLYKLLKHLDRQKFDPFVISLQGVGELGQLIQGLQVPVVALNMRAQLPNPLKLVPLANQLRSLRPDVVQTWMYHADLVGGLAARLAGCSKVVWGLRNADLDARLSKRSTLLVVKACAALSSWLPSHILSCSTRAKVVHEAAGYRKEKIHVIPNGFDLERFRPDKESRKSVREELGLLHDTPLVGLIARYDPQKNHLGFIEAAAKVHQTFPNCRFVLAGGGVDIENIELQQAIHDHDLASYIHLLGLRHDMPRLISSLDVLVSSSSYGEAFPNVLGEAMACGVPCVVTDVGDSAEIVHSTGKVVRAGDMEGLAVGIAQVLALPSTARQTLGLEARQRVASNFEIGRVARLYMDFYQTLTDS